MLPVLRLLLNLKLKPAFQEGLLRETKSGDWRYGRGEGGLQVDREVPPFYVVY